MAGENDQTRWVGIRPTNPPETIPVEIAGGGDCTKVEPCEDATEFKTLTEKRAPAIGDLQAISGFVRIRLVNQNVGAPNYIQSVYTVPAGKMFYLEWLDCESWQADPNTAWMGLKKGAQIYYWQLNAYGAASTHEVNERRFWYDEGEIVVVYWNATLAATDVISMLTGYLVDKY